MESQINKQKTDEELESLIQKENKLDSITFSENSSQKNALSLLNTKETKGKIINVKNAGDDIGLEISYKNTQFCIKLELPKSKHANKEEFIIFDLLKYYNIPNNKFLNLEGKEIYIIESKDENIDMTKNYTLSLPRNINNKSNKIFSYIQLAREKGFLNLYKIKNKTKIKIEPITTFPILLSTFILFYTKSIFLNNILSFTSSDIISAMIMIIHNISISIAFISAFYFVIFFLFLMLAIIDKLYEKFVINKIKKYWPF